MEEKTADNIKAYYRDRHLFCTGATGMVGTAYLSRLVLDTEVSRVYALVRGGESRLWKTWAARLPSEMLAALKSSGKLVVFDGDITLPNCGLSAEQVQTIQDTVSIIVHSASSINLKQPVEKVSRTVLYPSLAIGKMALACPRLEQFVYISTALSGIFLHPTKDGKFEGFDATLPEDIRPLRKHDPISSAATEFGELVELGTTLENEHLKFPFGYSYAKHLTERLLIQCFRDAQSEHKLLIFRPSVIGPAEAHPYPFYEIPGSSPVTTMAAAWVLNPPTKSLISSHLPDPTTATVDEVPVDIVVNRLIVHVAFRSVGCVHAVCGAGRERRIIDLLAASSKFRRFWWSRPTITWSDCDWKSDMQCYIGRLFVVIGCAIVYESKKSEQVWDLMSPREQSSWPLWPYKNWSDEEYVAGRGKTIAVLAKGFVSKFFGLPGSYAGLFTNASSRL